MNLIIPIPIHFLITPIPSFFIFIKLYFVYKVQGPSDQFFIFVVEDQGDDHSTTAIVTVAVGR